MNGDVRTCKKGHTAEFVRRSDGYMTCSVCRKESTSRRNKRYYENSKDNGRLEAKRAWRREYDRKRREAAKAAKQAELEAAILADVHAMRERVARRKRQQQLRRLLAAS